MAKELQSKLIGQNILDKVDAYHPFDTITRDNLCALCFAIRLVGDMAVNMSVEDKTEMMRINPETGQLEVAYYEFESSDTVSIAKIDWVACELQPSGRIELGIDPLGVANEVVAIYQNKNHRSCPQFSKVSRIIHGNIYSKLYPPKD